MSRKASTTAKPGASGLRRLLGISPASEPSRSFVDVEHEGSALRVAVRRVATARRFTLRVRSARQDVVLTMPPTASLRSAATFAQRHAGWIAERLASLDPPIAFLPGVHIPIRGEIHQLERRSGLRKRVWVEADPSGPPRLCVSGAADRFATDVLAHLRKEALGDLNRAVANYAAAVGRPVQAIRLRDGRSRWGSCSARGTLNFSWRLVMAPPFVLDYLAAHEVAHLVHMNHSDAFWVLTETLAPHTAAAEAWLKANGARLHRFGSQAAGPAAEPTPDTGASVRTKIR